MKKKKYIIAGVAIGLLAVICAAVGIFQLMGDKSAGSDYEEIRSEAGSGMPEEGSGASEGGSVEIPIDFSVLQERNPEVYAWITIPGTEVDYPILQSETDNSYYLSHTIDRQESAEGAIYTENYNSRDFEDPNTLIYGHDMQNRTMFGSLLDYQDRSFFEENNEILIYTPDAVRTYRIFASYVYDNRHIMQSFDFSDQTIFQKYIDAVMSIRDMGACIDTTAEVGADDKIITLSTCYGSQDDRRFLVQAVLVSIEK